MTSTGLVCGVRRLSMSASAISVATRTNPFHIHSTFRDEHGQKLRPRGLDWDMDGQSHLSYAMDQFTFEQQGCTIHDTREHRKAIVDAYNRWYFAKDLPFQTAEDIQSLSVHDRHVLVQWRSSRRIFDMVKYPNIQDLLAEAAASLESSVAAPPEVWINGYFVSKLSSDALQNIFAALEISQSPRLCYRRSLDDKIIRIERIFHGAIRGYQVYEHLLDNLYVMEDVEIIHQHNAILGTVTLPDWIMGGMLTSRLWVQKKDNGDILCLRPLQQDDPSTTDRTYRLVRGQDDDKIEQVKVELERLRELADLKHPLEDAMLSSANPDHPVVSADEMQRRAQYRRNSRKRFTL